MTELVRQSSFDLVSYHMPKLTGLVLIDLVNGFCSVGAGNLAPPAPDARIDQMIRETDVAARYFIVDTKRPGYIFCDMHPPGVIEHPYPLHCEQGTGEEELVPQLHWLDLEREHNDRLWKTYKDTLNGFIGAITSSGQNRVVSWVNKFKLEAVVCTGICTDICVMQFVQSLLAGRNHGMMPTLKDVIVLEPATATYDLPLETALALGLPATATHPRDLWHHIGLRVMAGSGAIIASEVVEV